MAATSSYVLCSAEPLQEFVASVFRELGADRDVADEVSRHLVRSNLSGHDSHGAMRVMQYVADADAGNLVPGARPVVLRETAVAALVDAQRGFGQFSTMYAMEWAIERARGQGVALVAIRHSTHIGRLGEYTERAVGEGLIGIVTVGAMGPDVGGVVPFWGRTRFLGTNPWSIAIPGRERTMMFDAATSAMAEGKVRVARASGKELPAECVLDSEGRPSRDPAALYAGGALLPLGGALAGHKGYGLSLASALIGGLGVIDDEAPTFGGAAAPMTSSSRGRLAGVFLEVIDPAVFGDAARYRELVDDALAAAKRVPAAEGREEVLVPGEPEIRARALRSREGIALPAATWKELGAVGERFGVPLPPARDA